jgi:hypothetical protein
VQRVLVPAVQFVPLYLLKVLFGGQSMNELPRWLFSNVALMKLVGFNAQQVEEGLTKGRCWAQDEKEARATHATVLGRQHQQVESRADGNPLQPDGPVSSVLSIMI